MVNMTSNEKVRLWAIRIAINLVVIAILSLACYIVFLAVTEFIKVSV